MPGRDHWSIGIDWFSNWGRSLIGWRIEILYLHLFETQTKILQMEILILVAKRLKLQIEYSSQLVIVLDYLLIDQMSQDTWPRMELTFQNT